MGRLRSVRSVRPSPVRWVLFDVGGVLVEWDDTTVFRIVANRYGLELGAAAIVLERTRRDLQSGGISLHEFWRRFARSFNVPVPEDWRTLWVEEMARRARPRRAVFRLVDDLHRQGERTGLFSNTDRSHWRYWRATGWFDGFFPQIVSFQVGAAKPDPEAFRRAEGLFPPDWGAPLFVDDSVINVKAARAAGWDAVLFTTEHSLRRVLQNRQLLGSRRPRPGE
jgi:putative hydrolase of the HAD superfamily